MAVIADDDLSYEYLSIIIDTFEKKALRSGTREGILVVANAPLTAMDNLMNSSAASLGSIADSRTATGEDSTPPAYGEESESSISSSGEVTTNFNSSNGELNVTAQANVSADADLNSILDGLGIEIGSGGENGDGRAIGQYLSECLGCNLRLKFDWQLRPLNLLGPINQLIDQVNYNLDSFSARMNPFQVLDSICSALNAMKSLCIPDILTMVMSIKMLLKRYMMNMLDIMVDWTVVLGPILQAIVQGVLSLVNNLASLLLAPLDCAISGLKTFNDLERETRELAAMAEQFTEGSIEAGRMISRGEVPGEAEFNLLARDVEWTGSTIGETDWPDAPEFGHARRTDVTAGDPPTSDNSTRIPTGFSLDSEVDLATIINDPDFNQIPWIQRIILPVQEARSYIKDLVSNINTSLSSVQELVSSGLSLQMTNLGVMLFLSDMIGMISLIIRMLTQNPRVDDWCSFLQANPGIIEDNMRSRYGNVDVRSESTRLILSRGPDIVAEIRTCAASRPVSEQRLLDQWIRDLRNRGSS